MSLFNVSSFIATLCVVLNHSLSAPYNVHELSNLLIASIEVKDSFQQGRSPETSPNISFALKHHHPTAPVRLFQVKSGNSHHGSHSFFLRVS